MTGTVTLIVGATVGIIILMWILSKPTQFGQVAGSIGTVYKNSVDVLAPKQQTNAG